MAVQPNISTVDDLNIGQHNVHGIESNKLQVENYLEKHGIHVLMLSELWLPPGKDFFLKSYKLLDQRRLDGYAGAGILFKNNISFVDSYCRILRKLMPLALQLLIYH